MQNGNITNKKYDQLYKPQSFQAPYLSLQFADTVKNFFDTYFASSVAVTSNIVSPTNVITNGYNLATFFKEALKLDRGSHFLNIHLEELAGLKLRITVSAKGGFNYSHDEEEKLKILAMESGFEFSISEGAFVLIQKMEFLTSLPLNATYSGSPLLNEFKRVFEIKVI